jgi:NhaA family Na+:H+ antiporter
MKDMTEQAATVVVDAIREFLRLEAAGGILLLAAAVVAMVCANTQLSAWYESLLAMHITVEADGFGIDKPLLLWVNDGLMAIFFFLIGLEIKREVLEGELSSVAQVALPGIGAIGGMVVPALIYAWLNYADAAAGQFRLRPISHSRLRC